LAGGAQNASFQIDPKLTVVTFGFAASEAVPAYVCRSLPDVTCHVRGVGASRWRQCGPEMLLQKQRDSCDTRLVLSVAQNDGEA
jgi:hypothetical protein